MKKIGFVAPFLVLLLFTGCSSLIRNPFASNDDDERTSADPSRVIEPTAKYSLAIGGVAPGRDELVIYDSSNNVRDFTNQSLVCTPDDPIVTLKPRPGYDTESAGSGVQMVATDPGVTAIHCTVDTEEIEVAYEVTIPPQNLIQILVAESAEQLADEAQTEKGEDGELVVGLQSVSSTGSALGAVIRNRIYKINSRDNPGLFGASDDDYDLNPPASYYDAVILAEGQFSPASRNNEAHELFSDAQDRNFLDDENKVAYDQAVITAAGIFNGDILDPTTGAFGFRSPTPDEWSLLTQALDGKYLAIPEGSGFSNESFPLLVPIQVFILSNIWTYEDGRPAFVFARTRTEEDYAVVEGQ